MFNPFPVPFRDQLTEDHLTGLVSEGVAEGYLVEYKREPPQAKKIARSIASLANTYGGWYIVGVETDQHNVAASVNGFAESKCPDPIALIREAAKQLNPVPQFFSQVVRLQNGNLAAIVYVPDDQETPFVAPDGRIYRRKFDSSDPVFESDRYAIDRLHDQGRSPSRRFERFAVDTRVFGSKQRNIGWLKVYLSPRPFGMINKPVVRRDEIRKLLESTRNPVQLPLATDVLTIRVDMACTAARTTATSVILQQTKVDREDQQNPSFEVDVWGRARLFIPINPHALTGNEARGLRSPLASEVLLDRLSNSMQALSPHLRFFDFTMVMLPVAISVNWYLGQVRESGFLTDFDVAIECQNVWNVVAFCDSDEWARHVLEFGLPVTATASIRCPEDRTKSIVLPDQRMMWMDVCSAAAALFGIPHEAFVEIFAAILLRLAHDNIPPSTEPFTAPTQT